MSSNELLLATEYLEKEKKIPRAVLIDAIEAALITAYKRIMYSAKKCPCGIKYGSRYFQSYRS